MINLEQALIVLIVVQAVGAILSYLIFKREIKVGIKSLFKEPMVSRAMGVMGAKSGEVRHDKAVLERIATQVLDGPGLKGLKMIGKQFGLDLDEIIAEEGAVDTLTGLQSLAAMAGIDIGPILAGSLKSTPDSASSGKSAYLPGE